MYQNPFTAAAPVDDLTKELDSLEERVGPCIRGPLGAQLADLLDRSRSALRDRDFNLADDLLARYTLIVKVNLSTRVSLRDGVELTSPIFSKVRPYFSQPAQLVEEALDFGDVLLGYLVEDEFRQEEPDFLSEPFKEGVDSDEHILGLMKL